MEYTIDPLLENLRFAVDRQKKGLLIVDRAMDNPTDYPAPYLGFKFNKFRIERQNGVLWRIHEVLLEYVFEPPKDSEYLQSDAAKRNLMKSHFVNLKVKELSKIIFQMVQNDNPYAEKYTCHYKGVDAVGTRFRLPNRFTINGDVGITRYGSDENQNWNVTARFDLMCTEKAYSCGDKEMELITSDSLIALIDDTSMAIV
jgi:hypothetical protein